MAQPKRSTRGHKSQTRRRETALRIMTAAQKRHPKPSPYSRFGTPKPGAEAEYADQIHNLKRKLHVN